jgi:hypothetical protein
LNTYYQSVQKSFFFPSAVQNTNKICGNIIIPFVLYGCETLCLTLREEYGLRVFENRVLRNVFGPKMDEVTGKWRRLHKEERHDMHFSPNVIRVNKPRKMRWTGHVARVGCMQGFGGET